MWRFLHTYARNFRKDPRVRDGLQRAVLPVAYLLLLCLLEIRVIWQSASQDVWTIPFYGLLFAAAMVVFVFIRRANREQTRLLSTSFAAPRNRPAESHVPQVVLQHLCAKSQVMASLLMRAGSEAHRQARKISAQQSSVICRQTINEFLRSAGLWDKLETTELALFSAADGYWTSQQISCALEWCEYLRLLRWTLRLDWLLTPLSHRPNVDYSLSAGIADLDRSKIPRRKLLQPSDLRPVADAAFDYYLGAAQELVNRGRLSSGTSFEQVAAELGVKLTKPEAFVVDGRRLHELDDADLELLFRTARARARYAAYLVAQLASATPLPFSRGVSIGEPD